MRPLALALALVSLPLPVLAQDPETPAPKIELFVGYGRRTHIGTDSSFLAAPGRGDGLRVALDWNLDRRTALVFTVPQFGISTSAQNRFTYSFLAGPRLRFRQDRRLMPFGQILFGVARGYVFPPVNGSSGDARTGFQLGVGGGVDVGLDNRFSLRLLQVEDRRRFGGPDTQNGLSFASGIVFRFGTPK